jgi:hypothetical protein
MKRVITFWWAENRLSNVRRILASSHQIYCLLYQPGFLPKGWEREKVKLSLCLPKHYVMKAYGGSGCIDPLFSTSTLVRGEWSASRLCRFTPVGNVPQYPLDRRLGRPESRYGRSLPGLELRLLRRPTRSQSAHRAERDYSKGSMNMHSHQVHRSCNLMRGSCKCNTNYLFDS